MYVRAKNSFNHGGIVKMNAGDCRVIDDDIAAKLIALDLVVETNPKSYKKIKPVKDSGEEDYENPDGSSNLIIGGIKLNFKLISDLNKSINKEQVLILLKVLKNEIETPLKNGLITKDELFSILYNLIKRLK